VRYARVFDADLSCVSELAFAGAGCPWEFQCSLPQYRTEQILTRSRPAAPGSMPSTHIWIPTWSRRAGDGLRCGESKPGARGAVPYQPA
jgi:hypothetical protein